MARQNSSARSRGFFATVWRVVRQIFHESIGALFLILALFWILAALRQWKQGGETWAWGALAGFALIFAGFGWSSFRAARRVR
jgi:hypothetical protein